MNFVCVGCRQTLARFSFALGITVGSIITKLATNAAGEEVSAKDATGDAANLCHDSKGEMWKWLSDEQMNNRWPFSLVNDEQMSNEVGG